MIHAGNFSQAREQAIMAHYRHYGAPRRMLKGFEDYHRHIGDDYNPWVGCYIAENSIYFQANTSRLHGQFAREKYTVEILYHPEQVFPKDPTTIFMPIPGDSLAHPWVPVECTECDCPVKTYHYQGLYMHRGSPCAELSRFGFSDPLPEVWEALKRVQDRVAEKKDREMVDRFVDYHAWVCTRAGETDIEEKSDIEDKSATEEESETEET